jgi:hypothetical protein
LSDDEDVGFLRFCYFLSISNIGDVHVKETSSPAALKFSTGIVSGEDAGTGPVGTGVVDSVEIESG